MIELDQYKQDLTRVRETILRAGGALRIDDLREEIAELKEEMNAVVLKVCLPVRTR